MLNSLRFRPKTTRARLAVAALEDRTVPAIAIVPGTPYTQNFDGLPASGSVSLGTGTTITPAYDVSIAPISATGFGTGDWFVQKTAGTTATFNFVADNGSGNAGAAVSYGTTGSIDRGLGTLTSGAAVPRIGAVLMNSSTAPITSFTLAFNAEQWRRGATSATTAPDSLTFSYALGASGIADTITTFTAVTALDATTKINSGGTATLDGNLPANFTAVSATVAGMTWNPGQSLVIRWTDFDRSGADDGLAIDNVTITATGTGTAATVYYADPAFTQPNGTVITDADPVLTGDQSAKVGTTAFSTIGAALAAAPAGSSVIVNTGSYAENLNLNTASITLTFQGGAATVGAINDISTTSSIALSATTLTFGDGTTASTVDSKVTGTGGITTTGTVTLTGDNTYAGPTHVAGGVLTAGSATAFGSKSAVSVDLGATARLNGFGVGVGSLTGLGTVENASATAATLTVTSAAATTTFDGTIQNGGAGALGVVFNGTASGSLTLQAAQPFTGPLSVTGGTLTVNGKLSGTSGVAVAAGATLAGTGSTAAPVSVSGTLSPNGPAAVGTFGVGNLTFAGTASPRLTIDIFGPTAGSEYDQLAVTGTVDLTGGYLNASASVNQVPAGGKVTLIANDGSDAVTGTFTSLGGAAIAEGATVTLGSTDFVLSYKGGTGNDVELTSLGPVSGINVKAGTPYTQNFDGLPASGTITLGSSTSTLYDVSAAPISATGFTSGDWFLQRFGNASSPTTNISLIADDGNSGSGGLYSYGAKASTDRALGALASGSNVGRYGAVFVNNDTVTLTQFTLSFVNEQWRYGGGEPNSAEFAYQIGATGIDFILAAADRVPDLDVVSVLTSSATAPLDGNAAANRRVVTATVGNLTWQPGQTLVVRWTDIDNKGTDDGLAIDDLTFTASAGSTVTQNAYYADPAFASLATGSTITDADPVAGGDQSAKVGTTAFGTVAGALGAAPAAGLVVVNSGDYSAESVSIDKAGVTVKFQGGASTIGAINDLATDATITLSGTALTINGAAASQIDSKVTGTGGLVKAGTGVVTLAGDNNYSGTTQVTAGVLQAGSAAGLSFKSAVSVDAATVRLNGFNSNVAGLTGTGVVENGAAAAATIAVSNAATTTTFDGTVRNGGAGALGFTAVGSGAANYTLTGDQAFTGVLAATGSQFSFTGKLTGASSVTVGGGTSLTATGSTTAPINLTGTLTPNFTAIGKVGVGDLKFSGNSTNRLSLDVTGNTPGVDQDQVNVTGTVNFAGGTLQLFNSTNYVPADDTSVVLLTNDGTDSITGTLTLVTSSGTGPALPEGTKITYGGVDVYVTYKGGDGNDLALIRLNPNSNATPTITSAGGGATGSVSVTENSKVATTVTATDPDVVPALVYSIVGGADASLLTINSSTGVVSFVNTPDFENPVDAGKNNVYDIVVQVDDTLGGTDQQALSITVTDVNPAVQSVVVNGGGIQRSMVTSLVVTFNTAVTLGANAFSISGVGSGGTPVLTGTVIGTTTATVAGKTVATLTFSGPNTAVTALGKSLVDGSYTLTVNAAVVAAGPEQMAANFTDGTIFRYLADADGDSAVDGNDLAVLATAFNSVQGDSNYLAYLDLDNDGAVDGNDLAVFAQRFNTVL